MSDDTVKPPSWFRVEHIGLVFQVAVVLGGLSIWLISNADRTAATAASMTTVSARLDRISDKLDLIPVLMEKVRQSETAITDIRTTTANLDNRVRAIEDHHGAN